MVRCFNGAGKGNPTQAKSMPQRWQYPAQPVHTPSLSGQSRQTENPQADTCLHGCDAQASIQVGPKAIEVNNCQHNN